MDQTGHVQLVTTGLDTHLNHQQQQGMNGTSVASQAKKKVIKRLNPNLPSRNLVTGPRENYLRLGAPLYEASINCDWKAAEAILEENRDLVRYSITDRGETALHIAASVKGDPKHVGEFVRKLVDLMEEKDLELENESYNTALYLAATAGNAEAVRIMVEKNRALVTIPGTVRQVMPLYEAAMNGNYEVVKYLYDNSNDLLDEGWSTVNRGWLLDECVAGDMFDVALQIVKKYPNLETANLLGVLARKPNAFSETKSNIIQRSVNSVFALIGLKVGAYKMESEALQLLRFVWANISNKPRDEIHRILRGSPDSVKHEESKLTSEKVVQTLQLQNLISEHIDKLVVATKNIIMRAFPFAITQDADLDHRATQLQKLISQYVVKMHVETQNMIKQGINKPEPSKGDQALELQKLISDHIVTMHVNTQNIIKRESRKEDKLLYLEKLISKHTTSMRFAVSTSKETYSSRVLFIAAEMGNTRFLVEFLRKYPYLMWKVNDNKQTIFHIAVKHRQEGVYNLLYEIGSMKDSITRLIDADQNNMLHLAAKSAAKERLADVSGAALQMQRELLWFKEVRNMIRPSYGEQKNKDGLTPRELFTKEHKELIIEGEKWMKGTASQCMVVAALIATIVFAAAFTIPGGYNQNDGIPIFYRNQFFFVFVVADAISLFLSTASILTFLSILTSRYAERDFVESLPNKLMFGVSTLFLSITAMMVTFGVSFFILYHKEMKWVPIFISVFAVMPVFLYVVLQYHLLVDVVFSTYGSRYLFKPDTQFLYYVNPRF